MLDTSTPSIYSDIKFAEKLKEMFPESKVVLVGTHPSALPEETLCISEQIDAVARHEFDYIVRDLARAVRDDGSWSNVKGITYRENGEIYATEDMPFIEQLDDIPFAAEFIKKYLIPEVYFFAPAAFPDFQIFSGRGCMA